jgi:hypothetical protein
MCNSQFVGVPAGYVDARNTHATVHRISTPRIPKNGPAGLIWTTLLGSCQARLGFSSQSEMKADDGWRGRIVWGSRQNPRLSFVGIEANTDRAVGKNPNSDYSHKVDRSVYL